MNRKDKKNIAIAQTLGWQVRNDTNPSTSKLKRFRLILPNGEVYEPSPYFYFGQTEYYYETEQEAWKGVPQFNAEEQWAIYLLDACEAIWRKANSKNPKFWRIESRSFGWWVKVIEFAPDVGDLIVAQANSTLLQRAVRDCAYIALCGGKSE